MSNPAPVSVDEAAYRPSKLKRSGRQRGGWVYLDAAILERAGVPAGSDVSVMRYALVERATRRDGSVRVRSRVVLNIVIDGPTKPPRGGCVACTISAMKGPGGPCDAHRNVSP